MMMRAGPGGEMYGPQSLVTVGVAVAERRFIWINGGRRGGRGVRFSKLGKRRMDGTSQRSLQARPKVLLSSGGGGKKKELWTH